MNINLVAKNVIRKKISYGNIGCLLRSNLILEPVNVPICNCSFRLIHSITSKINNDKFKKCTYKNNRLTNVSQRWQSSDSSPPSNKLPPLMTFPEIVWPSLIKSVRNFILSTFIIKPYFDREFNLPDFVKGAKKALEVVSNKLATGDVKNLEGLVTNDIIPSIQRSISLMSLSQREQLGINMEDIYFSFPYQVGVIFNDETGKDQKRYVEITMVFHTLKGLSQMKMRGEEPPLNMGMLPEYQKRISICNYRFIREFTKGVDGEWTINLLNHFKPSDHLDE